MKKISLVHLATMKLKLFTTCLGLSSVFLVQGQWTPTTTPANINPNHIYVGGGVGSPVGNGVYLGRGNFLNYNLAIGGGSGAANSFPLNNNTSGQFNTAIGTSSLNAITAGSSNTAIGHACMSLLGTSSSNNTSVGGSSMSNFTSGSGNTAIGQGSLVGAANASGSNNSAVGFGALNRITTGSSNVAIGSGALNGSTNWLTSGSSNVGIGVGVGVPNPAGDFQLSIQNIIYGVGNSGIGTTVSSGSIGIGVNTGFGFTSTGGGVFTYGGAPSATNFTLYVNGWTRATSYVALSDKSIKKEIRRIEEPLGKISKINGYTYFWDNANKKVDLRLDKYKQVGFLAQEVLEVLPEAVVICEDGYYGLNYNAIMPLLAEGIKEQQSQIELQKNEIEIQKIEIENLKLQIGELKNKFDQLTTVQVKLRLNSLDVLPNPITGVFVVNYKLDNPTANSYLIISDLQGRLIKKTSLRKNVATGQVLMSRNELGNGMYIFSIVCENAEVQSKKVLVTY